jgi:dipeptidyl aminopeptidase/acylaminoacyl peptidase
MSPDGTRVAFVVNEWDRREDTFTRELYVVDVKTGQMSPPTSASGKKRLPRWSPDGKSLAFLADTGGNTQLQVLRDLHDPPRVIVSPSDSIESFEWSPDGNAIALLGMAAAKIPPGGQTNRKPPVVADEEIEYQRLWIADLATGSLHQVAAGANHVVESSYSPDGRSLACLGQPSPRWPDQTQRGVYIVPVGGGEAKRVTEDTPEARDITWSPDGTNLAYLAATEGNPLGVGPPKIHVVPATGGVPRVLAADFDGYIEGLRWSEGGQSLLFSAGVGVGHHLYRIALSGTTPERLTSGDGVYYSMSTDRTGHALAAIFESPSQPPDVWIRTEIGRPFRALTALNPQVSDWPLGKVETTRWKSSDGQQIEGLVVYPVDYVARRRYPTVLYVHGGPESANMRGFSANWGSLAQVYAGAGFVVFMPNFRGSSNYGGRFALGVGGTSIAPEEGSFADCMTGLDHLIAMGIADSERLAIQGWSYGGYFTAWAIGHTTRFKVASEGAGDANLVSYYGTASINPGFDILNEHPYDDPARWHRLSPLTYVSKVRTPCLILQGEKDQIVPMGQSQEFHKALRHFGVATELVIYPGQPHGLQVPSYQIDKMRRELAWIQKHLASPTVTPTPPH